MSSRSLFGTDGIRGVANVYPMTPEVALALGRAVTFVAGRGATASTKSNVAENTYTVTFNKDVSKCSFTANAVGGSSNVGGFGVSAGQQPTQVVVDEPDTAAGGDGRDFHLQVIC